jgi:DNA replication and repair protein RecF
MTASRIHRLSLTNFRSYRAASLEASADMVALVGPNGAGKTNCIEAISFLSPGRGLRRATLEDVANNEGDGSWAVSATVEGEVGLATLGTGIDAPAAEGASTSRRCRIDREPVGSAAAFGDHLRMVWLTPAMDQLFMGAASERRRFFDRLVLAIDKDHSGRVSALERSLRSRNRLLEDRNSDAHWLDAIERETAELAARLQCGSQRCCASAAKPRRFHPHSSCSTAGWRMRWPMNRPQRSKIAIARSCAMVARVMPPPAARSTARISPICR